MEEIPPQVWAKVCSLHIGKKFSMGSVHSLYGSVFVGITHIGLRVEQTVLVFILPSQSSHFVTIIVNFRKLWKVFLLDGIYLPAL